MCPLNFSFIEWTTLCPHYRFDLMPAPETTGTADWRRNPGASVFGLR